MISHLLCPASSQRKIEGEGEITLNVNWKSLKEDKNKVLVDMSRNRGRASAAENIEYIDDVGIEISAGSEGGDRLELDRSRGEKLTKWKGPMVGESISKQPARWAEQREADDCPDYLGANGGGVTRFGEKKMTTFVNMAKAPGRRDADLERGLDDVGIPYGEDEGGNLLLSPHPSFIEANRKNKTHIMKQSLSDKLEVKRQEFKRRAAKKKREEEDRKSLQRKERMKRKEESEKTKKMIERDLTYFEQEEERKALEDIENQLNGLSVEAGK